MPVRPYAHSLWLAALVVLVCIQAAQAQSDDTVPIQLDITAAGLDQARSEILPSLGATQYSFTPTTLSALPQGNNASLAQTLLQAPGVAQDSFGQLHVRGDHANLQFRLDGVQLPEGLDGFGTVITDRFARSLSLITGALPAQYGIRQAGVIDIDVKNGITNPGGEISLSGGSHGQIQPSFSWGGRSGAADWFITGDLLHNNIGIEAPTGSVTAIHDTTTQFHGLAKASLLVNDSTRLSMIAGGFAGSYQIPNNPNQAPQWTVPGAPNSAALREVQTESTEFALASLQQQLNGVDVQTALFMRQAALHFSPDPLGDLAYLGIAQTAGLAAIAAGLQSDAAWRVADDHTIRLGLFSQIERATGSTSSQVFAVDNNGNQIGNTPLTITTASALGSQLYGLYVQDEWRITSTLTLNYGLRFDAMHAQTDETQLSPRVNLVWRPTGDTTVHAGYARYFTPPPFELVTTSAIAAFAKTSSPANSTGNGVVHAERSHYFDIGVSHDVAPGLTIGIDGYYKLARNLIDEGQFGAPIILTPFNYATADVHGVELTASYHRGAFSAYGNLAWSRAIGKNINSAQFNFSLGDLAYIAQNAIYLDHDQRWTSSAGVAYQFETKTRLSADLIGGSGLRAAGTVPNGRGLPAYATMNVALVQPLGETTQLRLDVINIADRVYEIRDGTGVGVGAPQYGLRRTILAGLTQTF